MNSVYFVLLSSLAVTSVFGFGTHHPIALDRSISKSTSLYAEGSSESEKFFSSEGWKPVREDLDRVPIFTVATKEGNPLAYTIQSQDGKKYTVPCFYCDIDAALTELKGSKEQNPEMEGLDLIPFPLGNAFQLWAKNEAVIVPSKDSIMQAGAPPGTNPIGQQVPIFACMDIMEEGEDGKGRLPVFLNLEDANNALETAVGQDGGSVDEFEVSCLSLAGIIDQLATVPETSSFHFIPPSSSIKYIEEYLS